MCFHLGLHLDPQRTLPRGSSRPEMRERDQEGVPKNKERSQTKELIFKSITARTFSTKRSHQGETSALKREEEKKQGMGIDEESSQK